LETLLYVVGFIKTKKMTLSECHTHYKACLHHIISTRCFFQWKQHWRSLFFW